MRLIDQPVCIDFETYGVEKRPDYPPVPVSVAIQWPGAKRKPEFYAWGHPSGNNCTKSQAEKQLQKAWAHPGGLLFQNAKYDLDVAEVHFGLAIPEWQRIHDTMLLLFLDDPHQRELGLKPSAERLLGLPPEEQDAVADWLVTKQPVPGVKIGRAAKGKNPPGKYIAYAPAGIVGPYACGDVYRTMELFKLLYPRTKERDMLGAYDRERELLPILLDMERQGVSVDLARLRDDVELYGAWQDRIDAWVQKRLKSPQLNPGSADELLHAMIDRAVVDTSLMPRTKTGKVSTAKGSLLLGVTDKTLLSVLNYRASLCTCMGTFMRPWLDVAERSNGLIYTTWNQVRGDAGGGARTGRLSSTPNFQNIPKVFKPMFSHEKRGAGLPRCPWRDLPALPRVRSYVVPHKGHVLIDRDFSSQEIRILAHFDGGDITRKYSVDPWLDFHATTQRALADIGKYFERGPVKNTNFGIIYGMGVGLIAAKNDLTVESAADLKRSILALYPGLKEMYREMKLRAANNQPIRTWGGREYYCEPAKIVKGALREFDYKMVNVLVQGSAADVTKQAVINFARVREPGWFMLLNVHDQITVSVPRKDLKRAMRVLRDAMEDIELDVPMLSEGKTSRTTWADLKDFDKKGELV